jgi:hypothetical protein
VSAAEQSWFSDFADQLQAFAQGLRSDLVDFDRDAENVWLRVKAPTKQHLMLTVAASPGDIEYSFGPLWTEIAKPNESVGREVLACCDAVKAGGVRLVRSRLTGLRFHIYRLRTRGVNRFQRDSDYSLLHYFRQRPRRVSIARVPPLPTLNSGY